MIRNEYGFTLIEALISLVILGIITLTSFNFILNTHDYIRLNNVLAVFQADLHYTRDFNMMPLNNYDRMSIRIYHEENRYVVLVGNEVYVEREFPQNVAVPHSNRISNISFNDRGNLGAGRTILFTSRYHERRVVFSIGVGGFDVR